MKITNWKINLGISLLLLSFLFYFLHYLLFRDLHHILIYLVGDVAFVFIEILLVTLVINGVLEGRDKKIRLEKVNMVIGVFFSEVGTRLLEILSTKDPGIESWQQDIFKNIELREDEYKSIMRNLVKHDYRIIFEKTDWKNLREFLVNKRDFMLRLLENANVLEHETFTDILWAIFHMTEELEARKSFDALPNTDYKHLYGDLNRVYGQLTRQWLKYMEHLKVNYPYLFSLALRTNPFNRIASPVVKE
jgi:hypothetical protein